MIKSGMIPLNVSGGSIAAYVKYVYREISEDVFLTAVEAYSSASNGANPIVIRWVAISERLPEMEVDVLLFDDWKTSDGERRQDMKVGYLSEFTTRKTAEGISHSCEWRGHEFLFNITHWMPLPEPPIV